MVTYLDAGSCEPDWFDGDFSVNG